MLTNYKEIKDSVNSVIREADRSVDDVTLVAVSKTVGILEVEDAARAGASDFGENRPDMIVEKARALPQLNWHFIGNIQSRRIKDIVENSCLIHSLCELKHAKKIDAIAKEMNKVQHVLVQINVSGEHSKSGVSESEIKGFLESCLDLKNLSIDGLMTMAAKDDLEHSNLPCPREVFERAHRVLEDCQEFMPSNFRQLSAGMTDDWPQAIKCGSTIVRVGRAIFS